MRYIDSLNLDSGIECFILIEPGRGYMIPVLREKFKNSKIIALHVDGSLRQDNLQNDVPALYGADSADVQKFLEAEAPEAGASRIRVIEWRPSMNYYGEAYVKLLSHAVEFIKRTDAGKRTASVFGRRWVRNFFKNLRYVKQTLLYRTADIPVIITGSGPGLEKALPVIRSMKDECLILAASSSVMALYHGGVSPDIVAATDGGPWALRHIYPYFRHCAAEIGSGVVKDNGAVKDSGTVKNSGAFAANLCAALPSQLRDTPLLIMSDGSFWQNVVLHELGLPSISVPQRGTVTASAVDLALTLSGGNIYLAGVDLRVRDIRTHARPYAFDHLLFDRACRFTPVYSQSFVRSSLIQDGGGLGIYSAWFKNQLASWPKRIFSLTAGHEVFENAPARIPAAVKKTDGYFKTINVNDDPALFCKRGIAALSAAMKGGQFAANIKEELAPLLLPEKKEVTEKELYDALTEAVCGVSNG